MDPKKQAKLFYDSLGAADQLTCKLLARGARIQRGRIIGLTRQLAELKLMNASQAQLSKLEAEIAKREALALKFDKLDGVVAQAIKDRGQLDKGKF